MKTQLDILKQHYKISTCLDSDSDIRLLQILKDIKNLRTLSDSEVNWLKTENLLQPLKTYQKQELQKFTRQEKNEQIKKAAEEEEKLAAAEKKAAEKAATAEKKAAEFSQLKLNYKATKHNDKSPSSNLYLILQKLDKQERLEATDVAWLTENQLFYHNEKITIEYHIIEAMFYEQEFHITKNQWNLPSASSHWRKAGEAQTALKLTDDLDWDRIKDKKLKSALLTTRGGAYRDIQQLNKAEKCAKGAIEYQADSHHPYTLMGAICYERGQYSDGDYWFNEAIKRGANPRDMDSEIKRVVRNAKNEDQRRKVVEYLLKKDPSRYAWAKAYLKKPQNKNL